MVQHSVSELQTTGNKTSLSSKLKNIVSRKTQQEGALDPTIYGFILRYSFKNQIIVVTLTLACFPILYLTLELPKAIVNHAIEGKDFPQPLLGVELEQIPYLVRIHKRTFLRFKG